jgi:hypothetical protein
MPKWASQPFKDLITDIEHLGQLLEMSVRGISVIQGMPQMVAAVAKAEDTSNHEETRVKLAEADKRATFAKREVENGFPVLQASRPGGGWGAHLALRRGRGTYRRTSILAPHRKMLASCKLSEQVLAAWPLLPKVAKLQLWPSCNTLPRSVLRHYGQARRYPLKVANLRHFLINDGFRRKGDRRSVR